MSENINGLQLSRGIIAAADMLEKYKEILNSLNVFPVADRDTGVNMYISLRKTADRLPESGTPSEILYAVYDNLLEYSRGNSGTILTLFFEGLSSALPESDVITGRDFALAFKAGADTACSGVSSPANGTILSVAAKCAQAGVSLLDFSDSAEEIIKRISDEARSSLIKTAVQNPVLKPLGVVDSGAFGFCLILDGILSAVAPESEPYAYPEFIMKGVPDSENKISSCRYCTEAVFRLNNPGYSDSLREQLAPMGNCFMFIKGASLCKLHIHTDSPDDVLETAAKYAEIISSKVDDMGGQHFL
ncbi:MAG: DAK2 domain-containing protein [Bacillota bacterium]|nr:DAK2 domain-containing protein [Bacillota bacterium]